MSLAKAKGAAPLHSNEADRTSDFRAVSMQLSTLEDKAAVLADLARSKLVPLRRPEDVSLIGKQSGVENEATNMAPLFDEMYRRMRYVELLINESIENIESVQV